MVCCFTVTCFLCIVCVLIGVTSLLQFCMGLYLTFLQNDVITINRLVKTERFDSYLAYVLFAFIGLGFISLLFVFFSLYGAIKQNRALTLFMTILWLFSLTLNLVMLAVSLLYYYFILSQLRPLLVLSLREAPNATIKLLDIVQLKYSCCGIDGKNDYNQIVPNSLPSSCCREPNCWEETDLKSTNSTLSSVYTSGCYLLIKQHLTIELWILIGVTGICSLLQIFAVLFLCVLNERYRKFDELPRLAINQLAPGVPMSNIQNVPKVVSEPMEITQI
ncbi:unnamed protein product [Adineta ricciae]|uniref:Tetraspanin n=1 Tax=Adineta ricciae TaxID=249248 RepID=A0A815EHA6_ADIRI|nr:unnamed protein product [Adineta ricciae]